MSTVYMTRFNVTLAIIRAYLRGTLMYPSRYLMALGCLPVVFFTALLNPNEADKAEELFSHCIKVILFLDLYDFYKDPKLHIKLCGTKDRYYTCYLSNILQSYQENAKTKF